MSKKSGYLSHLYVYHYLKLAFRTVLFILALVLYVVSKKDGSSLPFGEVGAHPVFWGIVWLFFVGGMVLRIFPSKFETIGCQKQLKRNYVPTGEEKPSLTPWKSTFIFTLCWVALNLVFGILYMTGVFDAGILILDDSVSAVDVKTEKVILENIDKYEGGGVLEIENNLGSMTINVPSSWKVDMEIENSLGGSSKPSGENANGPTLRIRGENNLGGVSVKYV